MNKKQEEFKRKALVLLDEAELMLEQDFDNREAILPRALALVASLTKINIEMLGELR